MAIRLDITRPCNCCNMLICGTPCVFLVWKSYAEYRDSDITGKPFSLEDARHLLPVISGLQEIAKRTVIGTFGRAIVYLIGGFVRRKFTTFKYREPF